MYFLKEVFLAYKYGSKYVHEIVGCISFGRSPQSKPAYYKTQSVCSLGWQWACRSFIPFPLTKQSPFFRYSLYQLT